MKKITHELESRLEKQLTKILKCHNDPLQYSEAAIKVVMETIDDLKKHISKHTFPTEEEEIEFFKVIKPHFLSKLLYFRKIYQIEISKPVAGDKYITKHYQQQFEKINKFYNKNKEFYKYYRSNNRNLDKNYFLRGKHDIRLIVNSHFYQSDLLFSTSHDFIVAQIIANDKLLQFLKDRKLQEKSMKIIEPRKVGNHLKWTAGKAGIIELIYALHTQGVFNHGGSDIKEMIQFFETTFQIELGQFHRTFSEISSRKTDRTKFLNVLQEKLLRRMDDNDQA